MFLPPRLLCASGAMEESLSKRSVLLVSSMSPASGSSTLLCFSPTSPVRVNAGSFVGFFPLYSSVVYYRNKKSSHVIEDDEGLFNAEEFLPI